MPAPFALAQHGGLAAASRELQGGDRVLSFLDDLYVLTTRSRAWSAFQTVATAVEQHAGVQTHMGKLKVWCRGGGPPPEDLQQGAPNAWVADKPEAQNGLVILGTPLGQPAFVEAHAMDRLAKEQLLLDRLGDVGDLQSGWVLLSQSAVPRANHTVRIVPPSLSRLYAAGHDAALWDAFNKTFGTAGFAGDDLARRVATLPGRMGGMGLRSAERMSEGAYWASWLNTLHVLLQKTPDVAERILQDLEQDVAHVACLREAQQCRQGLVRSGATDLPTWADGAVGVAPPAAVDGVDPTDFQRGWQCFACSFSETNFLEQQVLPLCGDSQKALLLSQSGGPASAWLRAVPSEPAYTLKPLRLQVAVRRRLRWPLPLAAKQCSRTCTSQLDSLGDHAASCAQSGRLKLRSRPVEKTWARVLREAGGRVRENVYLRDTTLPGIDPSDGRNIELVVTGLPVNRGVPLAVDATLVSPLHADGSPLSGAATRPGTALRNARRLKESTYRELLHSPVLGLLTAGCETGGRLATEAVELVEAAACARARTSPALLRPAAARAWRYRWLTMLSVVTQDALAATLVNEGGALLDAADAEAPLLVEVVLDGFNGL